MVTCQSANQLKTPAKFPEPSKWSLSLVHQAIQSWGRLLIWQLSRRQSLTPFTRRISHKHSLPNKLAVHRVLYPSMLTESWVEGKSVEEKDTQPTERTAALWGLSSKNDKNFGELHKKWTEAGVKASRATSHRRVKEFGYSCRQRRLTWAKEKKNWTIAQWSKVLFSDESKFCISFGNQGLRVWRKGGEAHSPSCLKSSVKFPQSVMIWGCNVICWCWSIVFLMIWGAMSSAGVGPLCFLKTNVTVPVYQDILEHCILPSADQLFKFLPKAPKVG